VTKSVVVSVHGSKSPRSSWTSLYPSKEKTFPSLDLANPALATRGLVDALRGEPRWNHSADAWGVSMLALAGLSVVTIAGAGFALRRYDPHRS
jgi:hypothetical protein